MSRLLAASVTSYVSRPVANLYTLADLVLDGGTLRMWNGAGYLAVGANTYTGLGDFGNIEPIKEDLSEFPRALKVTLAAVTSSNLLAEALAENLFNRPITIYRAWWDTTSLSVVNTPEVSFKGRINEVVLKRGDAEQGDFLELTIATRLRRESAVSYYTKEDLALTYSGDTFFNYVDKIAGFKSLWGQKPVYFNVTNPGGRDRGGGRGGGR